MKTFKKLRKLSKYAGTSEAMSVRLALMGDCATQLLATALRGYGVEVGLYLHVCDVDYDQIDAQVMDPRSELYGSEPEYVLIQMCSEKLFETFCSSPLPARETFAQETAERIEHNWELISRHCKARILQYDFVELNDAVFGSFGAKVGVSFKYQLRKLNYLLAEAAQRHKNVFILGLSDLQCEMGRRTFFDAKLYYTAKMPLSFEALPYAAKLAVDMVQALRGKIKKCVVLDLDNTLWGGVIGDDGMSGIQIGELGAGHAYTDLQLWLRELKNRGVILAVCSKNNEDTAREPFEKHPEMVLRLSDISMFVANWDDKASNIKYIQQTLNIGMDSMVFLDDNPFERNMVRSLVPDITVPELPEDPAEYLGYLQSLDLFETASYSEEDKDRTSQYQAEIGRVTLQKQFESIDDYLISLEMVAEAKPFDEFHYPRIAQLTQRSNQFNLRTVRYTEDDIRRIANDGRYLTIYYTLRDKFGDHGLISVVILEKQDDSTLFVDTWLMSCRVLKRGMEEFIVNKMISVAKENGSKTVIGEYLRTPKNAMVENIYQKMGFTPIGEGRYSADTDTFTKNKTYITEE